uniref:Uncharacterized protein n=1 Tax=Babesia bovis TaxID=5865 RepID=S6BAE7_BABBO|nr:hypothetical protein [Babesia bovis]
MFSIFCSVARYCKSVHFICNYNVYSPFTYDAAALRIQFMICSTLSLKGGTLWMFEIGYVCAHSKLSKSLIYIVIPSKR